MKYRKLGSTDLKVSEIGMGCWAIGGSSYGPSYGPTKDTVSIKAIEKALEFGCNFFDTADLYGQGHSEKLLGQALKNVREDVIIATKVGFDIYQGGKNFDEDYIKFALSKSLERLQTDYIDLYQLHNPTATELNNEKIFNTLDNLKDAGLIRNWGISLKNTSDLTKTASSSNASTLQLVYNALQQEAAKSIFTDAKRNGVGIIAREPLANGFLTEKYNINSKFPKGDIRNSMNNAYIEKQLNKAKKINNSLKHREESIVQLALKFVLSNDAVSIVIPGCKTPEQVEQNMNASEIKDFTKSELEEILE